jgi:hypothetical protein
MFVVLLLPFPPFPFRIAGSAYMKKIAMIRIATMIPTTSHVPDSPPSPPCGLLMIVAMGSGYGFGLFMDIQDI